MSSISRAESQSWSSCPWEQSNSAVSLWLGFLQTYVATLALSSRHPKALGQILHRGQAIAGTPYFCRLYILPSHSDKKLLFGFGGPVP